MRQSLESILNTDDSLKNALTRIEKAESKNANMDQKIQEVKYIGEKKDAKRYREMAHVEKDAEEIRKRGDDQVFNAEIRKQIDASLLRMAEVRVTAEIRIEELEEKVEVQKKQLEEAEATIKALRQENEMLHQKVGGQGAQGKMQSKGYDQVFQDADSINSR